MEHLLGLLLLVVPGLYDIEVRLGLPHVLEVAPPTRLRRCLSGPDIESGRAFFVRSENPLRACALTDYVATGTSVRYRIHCPGPNAASAEAEFEVTAGGYRGTIRMQMGGKNMTMSETHVAVRIGDCAAGERDGRLRPREGLRRGGGVRDQGGFLAARECEALVDEGDESQDHQREHQLLHCTLLGLFRRQRTPTASI